MQFYRLLALLLLNVFIFSQDLEDLSFGSENSLDIATWNIEWFPKNGQASVEYVTQIIQHLDLDILAMQELDNIDMFNQMLNELTDYTGYYESAWFAGLAYIYKTDVVQINDIYEIYTTSPYWSAFPRSPMVMDMTFMGENYFIINNHFKCCGDGNLNMNDESDEEKRRYNAVNFLKEYIDTYLYDKNVIVLGDLNDDIAESSQNNVFQNILNDTQNYFFIDYNIATGNSSNWSYPSWPSHLDHILITNELFDDLENSVTLTIKVDEYLAGGWNEYDYNISDHRPVGISFDLNSSIVGDLNNDNSVNILDIVILVNHILDIETIEFESADINNDGEINILDIVTLVNNILYN